MTAQLTIEKREEKVTGRALRRSGFIPATVYGPEIEPMNIKLDNDVFKKLPFSEYNHLIELHPTGGEAFDVLMKNVQKDFVTGEVQNIEFYKIKKGHKVHTKVALKFVGESEAVRMGGELAIIHKEVQVECVPRKIPASVEVDLSLLKDTGDHITYGDLKLPEEVNLLNPPTETICKADVKKIAVIEEPEAAAPAEGDAAEGEAKAEGGEAAEAKAEGNE